MRHSFLQFYCTPVPSLNIALSRQDETNSAKIAREDGEKDAAKMSAVRSAFFARHGAATRRSAEEIAKSLGSFAGRIGALNKQ